jgi:hypothetical protein
MTKLKKTQMMVWISLVILSFTFEVMLNWGSGHAQETKDLYR